MYHIETVTKYFATVIARVHSVKVTGTRYEHIAEGLAFVLLCIKGINRSISMKNLIFVTAALLSQIAWANVDDFNQLIEETRQEEELLREKLMNQTPRSTLDVTTKKDLSQVRREMVQSDSENVVVDDSKAVIQPSNRNYSKGLEKKNMKRISKELDITEKY